MKYKVWFEQEGIFNEGDKVMNLRQAIEIHKFNVEFKKS